MKAPAVAVIAVFLFSAAAAAAPYADAAPGDRVLLMEVQPFGSFEGVSVFNYGPSAVSLGGYSIRDDNTGKEGSIAFGAGISISPGERLTVVKEIGAGDWFSSREGVLSFGSPGITVTGSFALADAGDDVYLYRDGSVVDAMCYGSKAAGEGWSGPAVKVSSKKFFLRVGATDTDTAADWIATNPGFTNLPFSPSLLFDAVVTPFLFPESQGEPVYRALESAKSEVLISIYQLTSRNVAALLCELESRIGDEHVDVTVTLEGHALGYDMSTELTLMRAVSDAGGDVALINDGIAGNYERFSYFHNKYAVIDGEKVVITSENWTTGNMGPGTGNRGWGAVIESPGYAQYMRSVFMSDRDPSFGDIHPLLEAYPDSKPATGLSYSPPPAVSSPRVPAEVSPVLSPDNSYAALRYYMEHAESRIYSEQLDLSSSFTVTSAGSPVKWMADAAERGVDARFILDASNDSGGAHASEVNLINSVTGVHAAVIKGGQGFSTTHNKGLVIDDSVWLGSVNWTPNSFDNNREAAALMRSAELAEIYSGWFLADWAANAPAAGALTVTCSPADIRTDSKVAFTVHGGGAGARYEWDVLGDGSWMESNAATIVRQDLPAGDHVLRVRAVGTDLYAELAYSVSGGSAGGGEGTEGGYGAEEGGAGEAVDYRLIAAALIAILLAAAAVARLRRREGA
ncbi:MAG: phospholipase D-like domain-containing protein [Candidatus Methanoplasma sp.]|jgi:phosphatidylserine/phosphatidylglycerophosphate/cardiolipin synthase-like enzyme|nr:phospholipase D-like domain-containing protein [Candidatus Methanoplasma sp.]